MNNPVHTFTVKAYWILSILKLRTLAEKKGGEGGTQTNEKTFSCVTFK